MNTQNHRGACNDVIYVPIHCRCHCNTPAPTHQTRECLQTDDLKNTKIPSHIVTKSVCVLIQCTHEGT